jgi:hypothetical protein
MFCDSDEIRVQKLALVPCLNCYVLIHESGIGEFFVYYFYVYEIDVYDRLLFLYARFEALTVFAMANTSECAVLQSGRKQ